MRKLAYEVPKVFKPLTFEQAKLLDKKYPIKKSKFISFIDDDLRKKDPDLCAYGEVQEKQLKMYLGFLPVMNYLGSYDYENGEFLDYYEDDTFFIAILYKIEEFAYIESMFIHSLENSDYMWYNIDVK